MTSTSLISEINDITQGAITKLNTKKMIINNEISNLEDSVKSVGKKLDSQQMIIKR